MGMSRRSRKNDWKTVDIFEATGHSEIGRWLERRLELETSPLRKRI